MEYHDGDVRIMDGSGVIHWFRKRSMRAICEEAESLGMTEGLTAKQWFEKSPTGELAHVIYAGWVLDAMEKGGKLVMYYNGKWKDMGK